MKKSNIQIILVFALCVLPGACRYNGDLWNRASDKFDDVAPQVSYFDPDSSDAGITGTIAIRFDDDMMHSTLDNSTITIEDGSGVVPGSWSHDLVDVTDGQQTIARFTPSAGYNVSTAGNTLIRDTGYTITVSTDVRDYYGNYLASEEVGSFTTASGLLIEDSSIDTTTDPADHTIHLVFNDPPAAGWTLNVSGVYGSGTAFDQDYGSGSSGVTVLSSTVIISTGTAFDSGSTVTVQSFTNFTAEVDGLPLTGVTSINLSIP